MANTQNYSKEYERLKKANLRPTRQRVALVRLLFGSGNRHATPEQLHEEAKQAGVQVSLATVYNTLNQFTAAGLLRQVTPAPGKTFFDTNIVLHHHFYDENSQTLVDLPASALQLEHLPEPPQGKSITSVDVVVRVR